MLSNLSKTSKSGGIPKSEVYEILREDESMEVDGDEEWNQAFVDALMGIEEECANGACDDEIQRTHVLEYKVVPLSMS